ncbi:50S ribosomal protein L4 [Candidatus Woesearchaeota archaeon]|nr:50S ribosomal protein L4 [Candidatus Woesearchaeota archaeon]
MKISILDLSGQKIRDVELPSQFSEEFRPDLIQRAVLAVQSNKRQPYAASRLAGKRPAAKLSRRRRKYRGSYGIGISRVPRKIMTRRGTRMNWVGAFAPGTVGGRRAHPPKSEKIWIKKINDKERMKSIRSAIAATISRESAAARGHIPPENYPFALDEKFESLDKTAKVIDALVKLGFEHELDRASHKNVRAGKGKSRGRKYKKKKGPLIVVSELGKMAYSASNIPGIDVVEAKNLNAELLAPGGKPGRITIWTSSALNDMKEKKLFC